MSVLRQQHWLGQQRVDVPHLRSIEAAVAADFDLLAGKVMANKQPLFLKGFTILSAGAYGSPATELELDVAEGVLIHHEATEGGSIFAAEDDAAVEALASTNSNVSGSWTSSAVNYVSLDLIRRADDSTADVVQFIDPDSRIETPMTVPLARTMGFKIHISATPFSSSSNLAPIAKVTLDADGNVTNLQDARNLMFRLGSGGDVPDRNAKFPWTAGRSEVTTTNAGDPFSGGDRQIGSLKEWADSVMTRLWELGGGTYWYSAGNQFNVRMTRSGTLFSNGENFEWDGTHLHWKNLKFVFDNASSTIYYNTVTDQTTDATDLTDLADGECVYVDLDRTGNNAVTAVKSAIATLGMSTIPGQRFVIAWRVGSSIFTRDFPYTVGSTYTPATSSSVGVVRLNLTSATPSTPDVAVTDANGATGKVIAAGLSRGNGAAPTAGNGALLIGTGSNDTAITFGRSGTTATIESVAAFQDAVTTGSTLSVDGILYAQASIQQGTANSSLILYGNRSGADAGDDVQISSVANRSNGNILSIFNNSLATRLVNIRYDGGIDTPALDTITNAVMSLGATRATTLTIGRTGQTATFPGTLSAQTIDRAGTIEVGGVSGTTVSLGRTGQNQRAKGVLFAEEKLYVGTSGAEAVNNRIIPPAYGNAYAASTSIGYSITTTATVFPNMGVSLSRLLTWSNGSDTFTVNSGGAGVYKIEFHLTILVETIDSGTPTNITAEVVRDFSTTVVSDFAVVTNYATGDYRVLSGCQFVELGSAQTIDLRLKVNNGSMSVRIDSCTLTLTRVAATSTSVP